MSRQLTPQSSLEHLKREAKRWLRALRDGDPAARARLGRAHPNAPPIPTLRDVQLALARELGFQGWTEVKTELARRSAAAPPGPDGALSDLLGAADRGDAERVRLLLDAHPDLVNERGVLAGHTGMRTPLHFAVNCESEEIITLLLERGADPNIRDDGDNAMPLHFAAEKGNLGIVRRLIEAGADPIGAGDHHELEVIGWATCFARTPQPELVTYLLANGARHTIFSAVATGAVDAIPDIVRRDPAVVDRRMDAANRRRTPLHLAVVQRQQAALDLLLDLGADREAEDAAGLTALDQAALSGERAMAERLIDAGATLRLPAAVALERQADIERLVAAEPHALRPGGRWDKVLIRASERAPGRIIELLIRNGASVFTRDDHRTAVDGTHGFTALHAAAFHGNLEAVRVLLHRGANPADREDRYWATPVGWANYAHQTEARDLMLDAPIDIFDAIEYGRLRRIDDILRQDPGAIERPFREYVNGTIEPRAWLDPAWTPLAYAVANRKHDAARLLLERGADRSVRDSAGRSLQEQAEASGDAELVRLLAISAVSAAARTTSGTSLEERAAAFLRLACLDWRVGGSERRQLTHDAGRMLDSHPELARANFYTAVVCGETDVVRRALADKPELVSAIGGPRGWPPILYLCAARLPQDQPMDAAVDMLRLLLDRGADPNAFYLGGNADIHYTALTVVLGRGEELAAMHPRARELTQLLLERGANPHDGQVLYNVFADNTSRHLLDDDLVWLLELMYEHSIRRGHGADWENPHWPMFDQTGAPSLGDEERRHHGAHFMLSAAVDRNLLGLAEWMLSHGADPNTPWGTHPPSPRTLYQDAIVRGYTEMAALLARFGAASESVAPDDFDAFLEACMALERERATQLGGRRGYLKDHRALFAAVERDRDDVVAMLLDLGVSPDVSDLTHGGMRALHLAAAKGSEKCATLLIERGATVDAVESIYGGVPLSWANYFDQQRLVELIGAHSRDVWRLAYTGLVDRLRTVLAEEPARARASDPRYGTPLFWLPDGEERARQAAALLLEHGADPAFIDERGRTAADVAAERGMESVASLLRARARAPEV